uniref:DOMON domain-containing protein n=1 Tax=Meloidogyne javanica TaxID=6303 RepID=A0A915M3M1_MELJA
MLTGIAFGDKDQLDFIGISSINDQLDLVSGHGEWQLRQEDVGHTFFDGENKKNRPPLIRMRGPLHVIINNTGGENGNNNQSGALPIRAISLKKQPTDGSVIAEFARLLAGDGEQLKTDLSKCTNFFLITRWISYNTSDENENSGNNGELPSILTTSSVSVRRTVCALVDEFDVSGKGDPCRFAGPTYSIEWWIEVDEKEEEIVNFLMKQKARKGRWWSAIGIGDNMSDMDIGTIFLENGEPKAMIDYFSNSYNLPIKDIKQDWKLNKKLSKWPKKLFVEDNNSEDGQIVELYFSRKITTEDENDRSMDDCVLFQFGANLGIYGPPGFRLHKHQDWPDLYKACNLKNHCMRHKRQNGGNDRNNFVNIPTLSHSIDENQTNNSINVTDKAIELLMKSLGPKIVQTVTESDKNETENKTKLIPKEGQKEEINEEDNNEIIKGKATIIPLLINSKQQSNNNGMQISEGNDVSNEKKNENKQNDYQLLHFSTASVIRQSGEGGVSAEDGGLPLESATNVTLPSPPQNETNNLNSSSQQQNSETFTSTTILPTTVEIQQSTLNNKIEETLENSTTALAVNTTLTVNLELTNATLINNETSTGESNISTNTAAEITTQPTTFTSTEKTNKPTNVYLTIKTTTEKHQMETSNSKANIPTNSPETTKTTLNKTSFSNLPGLNEQPEERGIKLPIVTSKCDALRPDLPICRSYMDTYIERVKDWSERHGEPLERQFPKACRLLNSVPHVPTLCCQLFNDRCNDFI